MDVDLQVRLAAFAWLSQQASVHGDVFTRQALQEGLDFEGQRVPLVAPQGIFKPRMLELPLSITTVASGPYDDYFGKDGFLLYRYRGTDPKHRDNVGLRNAWKLKKPLAYFHALDPGKYLATWSVYIIGDNPRALAFKVAVDDAVPVVDYPVRDIPDRLAMISDPRHAYLTTTVKVRLHQRSFRERVLDAYRSQCAFCRLRHRELLDAAHIIPDDEPSSRETIDNGLSLCKLHHAAFDRFILGVRPDYVIEVRDDVLTETDGPVLQHALKGLHNTRIMLPPSRNQWPSRDALAWRHRRFAEGS